MATSGLNHLRLVARGTRLRLGAELELELRLVLHTEILELSIM